MFIAVEFLLLYGGLVLFLLPLFVRVKLSFMFFRKTYSFMGLCSVFFFCLFFSCLLFLADLLPVFSNEVSNCLSFGATAWEMSFIIDAGKVFLIFFILCFCTLFFLEDNFKEVLIPARVYEFFSLVVFQIMGIFCFIMSSQILSCYLSLELQSLSLSIIIASRFFNRYSSEAALKYFLVGSFSTVILLFSFSLLYGVFGVSSFESLYLLFFVDDGTCLLFKESCFLLISLFLFLVAFFTKIGVAPFHFWIIDVYDGVSLIVVFFLMIVPKLGYMLFLIKWFFYFLSGFSFFYLIFFQIIGLVSVIFGTFGAVLQRQVRRFFAFSGIANFGYILLAFNNISGDNVLIISLFLIVYIFVLSLVFFCLLGFICVERRTWVKGLSELSMWFTSSRVIWCFSLCFGMLAMAGIPPLNMFFAKYLLLFLLLQTFDLFNYFISLGLILCSIISCFYYIRFIRLMFFKNIGEASGFKLYTKPSYLVASCISFFFFSNFLLMVSFDSFFSILQLMYRSF